MNHGISKGLVIEMDPQRQHIIRRLEAAEVDQATVGIACYDWSNWQDHYYWCMTAPISEILDWAEIVLRDEPEEDEV